HPSGSPRFRVQPARRSRRAAGPAGLDGKPELASFERAAAFFDIQIRSAARTQAAAVLATQRPGRQRQDGLLCEERAEIDFVAEGEAQEKALRDHPLARRLTTPGRKEKPEGRANQKRERLEAARAGGPGLGVEPPTEEQLVAGTVVRHVPRQWSEHTKV